MYLKDVTEYLTSCGKKRKLRKRSTSQGHLFVWPMLLALCPGGRLFQFYAVLLRRQTLGSVLEVKLLGSWQLSWHFEGFSVGR